MGRRSRRWRAGAGLALAAGFVLPGARAADPMPLTEQSFLGELPVVLSVSRLRQPQLDAPSAITVLDRETIRASGARKLTELLRLVPGFFVSYLNGHHPLISYHGVTDEFSRRMQVLVDGRSVYMPPSGGVDWTFLPVALEDIERIEVVRGPNAASYGANSFMGVINIITRDPSEQGGLVAATGGQPGVADGVLRLAGRSERLDYRVTLGQRSDHGFEGVNDDSRAHFASLRGDYAASSADTVQVQLGYSTGERGVGFADSEIDVPRDVAVRGDFQQLRWQRMLGSENELSLQFFRSFQRSRNTALSRPITALGGLQAVFDDSNWARRYDLEVQHSLSPGADWRLVWGAGARRDETFGPLILRAPVQSHLQRLFGHAEWRPHAALVVNAGAMAEHNDLSGTDVSPRLALNWRVAPHQALRASYSSALRTPQILEEYGYRRLNAGPFFAQTYLASGGLAPEKIISRELGYVGEFPAQGLNLDLKLYHDSVSRLIGATAVPLAGCVTPPAGFCLTPLTNDFRNIDGARLSGAEAQLHWQPSSATRFALTYARQRIESQDFAGPVSHSAPDTSLSLFASQRLPQDFLLSAVYYQQSAVHALSGDPMPLMRRLDLRLAKSFDAGGRKGEAALVIENLANDHGFELYPENGLRRQARFSLGVEF